MFVIPGRITNPASKIFGRGEPGTRMVEQNNQNNKDNQSCNSRMRDSLRKEAKRPAFWPPANSTYLTAQCMVTLVIWLFCPERPSYALVETARLSVFDASHDRGPRTPLQPSPDRSNLQRRRSPLRSLHFQAEGNASRQHAHQIWSPCSAIDRPMDIHDQRASRFEHCHDALHEQRLRTAHRTVHSPTGTSPTLQSGWPARRCKPSGAKKPPQRPHSTPSATTTPVRPAEGFQRTHEGNAAPCTHRGDT